MVEMKDSGNRGQGNCSGEPVTQSAQVGDLYWRLERLEAIHRQLLTGLAAVGELYRLQDVWTTYSGLLRHERPDAADRITTAELLAELKPSALAGNRDDVWEFASALRLLKGLRAEIEATMRRPAYRRSDDLYAGAAVQRPGPHGSLDAVAR